MCKCIVCRPSLPEAPVSTQPTIAEIVALLDGADVTGRALAAMLDAEAAASRAAKAGVRVRRALATVLGSNGKVRA